MTFHLEEMGDTQSLKRSMPWEECHVEDERHAARVPQGTLVATTSRIPQE